MALGSLSIGPQHTFFFTKGLNHGESQITKI